MRTAADMTVRQIISLLFDRVADELGVTATAAAAAREGGGVADGETCTEEAVVEEEGEEEGEGRGAAGQGALRCAHLVFQVRLAVEGAKANGCAVYVLVRFCSACCV